LNKQNKLRINIIGAYQIIGGLIGLYIMVKLLLKSYSAFIFMPFSLIYIASIVCGIFLLKGKYKKGIDLSIINQAFQIIGFSVLGFGFFYVAGLYAGLRIDLTNDIILGFNFDVSHFKINFNSNYELTYISINFIPIIILSYLFSLQRSLKDHKAKSIIEKLGVQQ